LPTDIILRPLNPVPALIPYVFNVLFESRLLRRIFGPKRDEMIGRLGKTA
jgi:hypothetical protein